MTVSCRVLDESVGDNSWSHDGSWIAYSKHGSSGHFEVWAVRPDGTDRHRVCGGTPFPRKNNGGVDWYPGDEFLVFTAQNEDATGLRNDLVSKPGIGFNCNLWVGKIDGSAAWRLTDYPTSDSAPRAVIHPQFSADGGRLFWAEATGRFGLGNGFEWGEWTLATADISFEDGTPRLSQVVRFQPGERHSFYESHDFSPDGTRLLLSGNLRDGQPLNGLDIYEYQPANGSLRPLTDSFNDWDEHAHYSPDGGRVMWMSGRDLDVEFPSVQGLEWQRYVKTELWMMNSDGSNQTRLTYFNEPGHPDHLWLADRVGPTPRAIVSDSSFDPGGKQVVFTVAYEPAVKGGRYHSLLVLASIDELVSGDTP
jgi:Tol biopolymer transport system component